MPVNKSRLDSKPTVATHLPCKFCKGFYKKRFLHRHVKTCPHNNEDKLKKINAQSEGQSLFAAYKNNDVLRASVFPIMRPDPISFAAKTDLLICAVARRYLKSHREKQFRLVASRKMRQLATLLLEIRKKINVKNLLEALDPVNFDLIVKSTKIISRYDPQSETYGAPSLASHMGTELKDCIDVAYSLLLKKYAKENEDTKKLKTLKELIINEWRYEVSTLANHDLQRKKWNKPSLIPLAEDITLLKTYLHNKSSKCRKTLEKEPQDIKIFKTLIEITFFQVLLLNRRRIGELQRMTLEVYTTNINNKRSNEFDKCISESEKVLMNSFKRVVIRGKRGRGVPVLFTDEMMHNMDLIIKLRKGFERENNVYLFPNLNCSTPINGQKAVSKHVQLAGAKNVASLTSTRLRKHLATMSQVINLSEQDLEQLANFMGHTSEIHKTYYRLPSDVYQMAKVSKLLLLNERGETAKYKGLKLDDINIDLDVVEEDNSEDELENDDINSIQSKSCELDNMEINVSSDNTNVVSITQ